MRKQQGVALITVLLVMAIIAVIATNLGTQLQRQVTRTASFEQSEQSYWMWLSGEAVLKEVVIVGVVGGGFPDCDVLV